MIETLLPYWIAVLFVGVILIAIRKGWLEALFGFLSSLFFGRPPKEIDLNWEVRRIRRLLEFFYFLAWLGLVIGFLAWLSIG